MLTYDTTMPKWVQQGQVTQFDSDMWQQIYIQQNVENNILLTWPKHHIMHTFSGIMAILLILDHHHLAPSHSHNPRTTVEDTWDTFGVMEMTLRYAKYNKLFWNIKTLSGGVITRSEVTLYCIAVIGAEDEWDFESTKGSGDLWYAYC